MDYNMEGDSTTRMGTWIPSYIRDNPSELVDRNRAMTWYSKWERHGP